MFPVWTEHRVLLRLRRGASLSGVTSGRCSFLLLNEQFSFLTVAWAAAAAQGGCWLDSLLLLAQVKCQNLSSNFNTSFKSVLSKFNYFFILFLVGLLHKYVNCCSLFYLLVFLLFVYVIIFCEAEDLYFEGFNWAPSLDSLLTVF